MHHVALIVYPQFQSLSMALGSVFECANLLRGEAAYHFSLVSESGGLVASSQGFAVETQPMQSGTYDTVIVSGFLEVGVPTFSLLRCVTEAAVASRRVASLCTGIFVLAEAGLLAGKRATTHWLHAPAFAKRYPNINLEDNRLFVVDGQIWTGAGMSAGIDMALAMVEHDLGRDLARQVAYKLLLSERRSGEHSQCSALLAMEPKSDRIQLAIAYARENLRSDLSVEALAGVARLSSRQFSRVFREQTGETPAKCIEKLRVEAARLLLETSGHPVEVIAREAGFVDRERLRQAFLRAFGKPPQAIRKSLIASV